MLNIQFYFSSTRKCLRLIIQTLIALVRFEDWAEPLLSSDLNNKNLIVYWKFYDKSKILTNLNSEKAPWGKFKRGRVISSPIMTFPQLECIVSLIPNIKYWIEKRCINHNYKHILSHFFMELFLSFFIKSTANKQVIILETNTKLLMN